jgi:hypothetical protein
VKKGEIVMNKLVVSFAALAVASLFVPGCAVDTVTEAGNPDLDGALSEALADESFQATIALLQSKGIEVDLSAAAFDRDATSSTVSFPLAGEGHEALAYELNSDGTAKVIVKEVNLPEGSDLLSGCGTYKNANTCNYGPWLSGQGCPNGPLYRYENRTRRYYQNGRQVTKNYDWFSCTWMAQPADCTSTC